jgi:hypothetical protein
MNKRISLSLILGVLVAGAIALYSFQRWRTTVDPDRAGLLAAMPSEASTIVYADLTELRGAPFTAQLYKWAPQPQIDPEYAQFLHATDFDYERDLDRVAIATIKRGQESTFFAVADGRFDRPKIDAYVGQTGVREKRGGLEIISVRMSGSARAISLSFLRKDRIALTDDPRLKGFAGEIADGEEARQWHARFDRLSGSPIFAVIRQDAAAGTLLASRSPGGLQSPQLSSLLNQLQWVTMAGKPEGDRLRIIAEGECGVDSTARQLADFLNGILLLAQTGLNGPEVRMRLEPKSREAYLEVLRGADVSRIDRGETKSVRVVVDITPKFLEAVRMATPAVPAVPTTTVSDKAAELSSQGSSAPRKKQVRSKPKSPSELK